MLIGARSTARLVRSAAAGRGLARGTTSRAATCTRAAMAEIAAPSAKSLDDNPIVLADRNVRALWPAKPDRGLV